MDAARHDRRDGLEHGRRVSPAVSGSENSRRATQGDQRRLSIAGALRRGLTPGPGAVPTALGLGVSLAESVANSHMQRQSRHRRCPPVTARSTKAPSQIVPSQTPVAERSAVRVPSASGRA